MTKPKFSLVDEECEQRMCVLPEYDGTGNQHILDGRCTATQALEHYRKHYAKPGMGAQEIIDVNPATIGSGGAAKLVWLPITAGLRQVGVQLRGEAGKLRQTIANKDAEIRALAADLENVQTDLDKAPSPAQLEQLNMLFEAAQARAMRQAYTSMALGIAIAILIVAWIIIR